MNKKNLLALLLVAALAALFVAAPYFIGHRVAAEFALLQRALAERDDVIVTRFDYQRGFRDGTLHYDLRLQAEREDSIPGVLQEAGLIPQEGLRLAGTLQLRHGPWTGMQTGFALAGTQGDVPLPAELRHLLPQYSEQQPLLQLTGRVGLGGGFEGRVTLMDYRGLVTPPQLDGRMHLDLAGVRGTVRSSARLDRGSLEMELQQLAMSLSGDGASAELRIDDLAFEGEAVEARPWIWTGESRTGIGQVLLALPHHRVSAEDLHLSSDTWIADDRLHSSSTTLLGRAEIDGYSLRGGELSVSIGELDMDILARIVELAETLPADGGDDPAGTASEQLAPLFEQLLAAGARLAIDRLSLAVVSDDDLLGQLEMQFETAPGDAAAAPYSLARALRADASLRLRLDALRHGARSMAMERLPANASEAEIDAAAASMFLELVTRLQAWPFLQVDEEQVSVSAQVLDGRLLVGGAELMDVEGLIALALASMAERMAETNGADPGARSEPGVFPEREPLYGRFELGADFRPDPLLIDVVAGGEDDLDEFVGGGCVGWVNGERPDVVIGYAGGSQPLYIYAVAGADTTLAVRDPRGLWQCNDDALGRGFNPGLELIDPPAGDYAIWLGTLEGGGADAVLAVSEKGDTP
jgi:uncharacterized protein YdgA (DUF945 family)